MQEAIGVDLSRPVSAAELVEVTIADETILIPEGCSSCRVLTAKRAAEARGMIVRGGEYFPPGKTGEMREELIQRAANAGAGLCRFVQFEPDCWHRDEE